MAMGSKIDLPRFEVIMQGITATGQTLLGLLEKEIASLQYKRLSACAAYASYRGTLLLRSLLSEYDEADYRWLIGLDDELTDPQALRVARETRGSMTRVSELLRTRPRRRFHPKAYLLDAGSADHTTLIIGSCNMTEAALKTNCEAIAVYRTKHTKEAGVLREYWESLWRFGQPLTEEILEGYAERFQKTPWRDPVVQEEKAGDPAKRPPHIIARALQRSIGNSKLAWIVLGKNTGGGNQLDIVKNLSPFLGLVVNPLDGKTVHLNLVTASGKRQYQVTFTKGMWRFMNLQQGFSQALRPNLREPSPYILVLERPKSSTSISMRLVDKASAEAKRMVENSRKNGFVGMSVPGPSGRRYGWY